MTDELAKKKRTKIWVAIIVIAAVVIGYGGASWYLSAQASKTYNVPLVVNAKGLDTETGTKIPIHATGQDSEGNNVDSVFYGGSNSSDIALKPGDYTLAIEASPIAEDGTIYDTKDAATKVSIAKDGKAEIEKEITIEPIPAEEVTDEQIDAAYNAAKDSGIDASQLDELKEKAQKRKDDAVAAKKAEEEKKAAKKKAAKKKDTKAKTANGGHSFMSDYFYVDVPSSWKSSEWSVKQVNDHTWTFTYEPANNYGGQISIAVAKDNPWPMYGTQNLGSTGTGLNVYMGNGAGSGIEQYLKVELTKTWNPDDPDSVRGDGIKNSEWEEIQEGRQKLREQQTGKQ